MLLSGLVIFCLLVYTFVCVAVALDILCVCVAVALEILCVCGCSIRDFVCVAVEEKKLFMINYCV